MLAQRDAALAFEQRLAGLEQEIVTDQRRHEAQQAPLGQQEARLVHQAVELDRLREALAPTQNELHQVISERDRRAVHLQDLVMAKADTERRLDATQQALIGGGSTPNQRLAMAA